MNGSVLRISLAVGILSCACRADAGIIFEYNAGLEANPANGKWEPNINNSDIHNGGTDRIRDLTLTSVVANNSPGSSFPGISRSYTFPATGTAPGPAATTFSYVNFNSALYADADPDIPDKRSSAFEVWFKPNRLNWSDVGTNGGIETNEILFENGGGNGVGLGIEQTANGADLIFSISRDSGGVLTTKLSHSLTDSGDNHLLSDFIPNYSPGARR